MVDHLWTESLTPLGLETLDPSIKDAVKELGETFCCQEVRLIPEENLVAVALEVDVDLPSRGTADGVDIRQRESIILVFDRKRYPFKAPQVYSNRRDFPAKRLPHLNPTPAGHPAHLCLHRGSLDDWFAEHGIVEFVRRVQGWLRDAARARLLRENDGFEPTRITRSVGYIIYSPDELTEIAHDYWSKNYNQTGYSFLVYERMRGGPEDVSTDTNAFSIRLVGSANGKTPYEIRKAHAGTHFLFGLLLWPSKARIFDDYLATLPDTLGALTDWMAEEGLLFDKAFQKFLRWRPQYSELLLPVTILLSRPRRLIGSQTKMELLNLLILDKNGIERGGSRFGSDSPVVCLAHRKPFSSALAKELSSVGVRSDLGRILAIGCGAVGSKLILHLARSGHLEMTVVDSDLISPHNLVRHGLLAGSVGRNKAEATKQAIVGLYTAEATSGILSLNKDALDILLEPRKEFIAQHEWLVDATASNVILDVLSQTVFPTTLRCCRCEIADRGRVGLLFIEGQDRNPRVDDLQAHIFDMAFGDTDLSEWLSAHHDNLVYDDPGVMEEIGVGLSCSSETMRLSDELVSLHASTFALGLRAATEKEGRKATGHIQIGLYRSPDTVNVQVQGTDVKPVTVIHSQGGGTWEIRMKYGLAPRLNELLTENHPNETGGLLIGRINTKWKRIYITRILEAPPDSEGSPYAFKRGIQDVPELVTNIYERTGGMISYVGEWHTHPEGGSELSLVDEEAVQAIKPYLDRIGIPTHIMIVTAQGSYSHVFPVSCGGRNEVV